MVNTSTTAITKPLEKNSWLVTYGIYKFCRKKKNATIKASVVQVRAYLDGHLEFGGLEDDQVVVLLPETIL